MEQVENGDQTMVASPTATDVLRRGRRLPQYAATIAATTGAMAGGCVLGWSSPAESEIKNNAYHFFVSENEWTWIGSLANVGAIISCLMIGIVMDKIGRKITMLLLIVPFTIGWALIIWPTSVIMIYIGRFCTGYAGGAFFVVAPTYIGEIATKDIRGTLGSCLQLMVTVGILFSYVAGAFIKPLKIFNIICGILPLVFGVIFIWMPESPYFYVTKNNMTKAKESIKWLRGEEYDYEDELDEIQHENELVTQNRVSFFNAITKPATIRALMITLGLVLFVQFSGINAVIFYTGSIFESANTGIKETLATIIVGIMQVVATFVASLTIDKLGRRILLVTSAMIMCICNIGLGVYFYLKDKESDMIPSLSWLLILSLCVYIIAFSLGLGPVPWVLVGEIYAIEVKAIASSLTGSTSWLISFIVTKFFKDVNDLIGIGQTFFIFAVCAAICALLVIYTVPETKGKSFNEIQRALYSGTNIDDDDDDNQTTVTSASQNTIAI